MWRTKNETKPAAAAEPVAPAPAVPERNAAALEPVAEGTRISRSISIQGEIAGREDLYVDGEMRGRIHFPDSQVIVGPHGRVTAEIEANEVILEGRLEGNVRARTRVEMRRSAEVRGDVVTQRIAIQEGARFRGRIELVRPEEARLRAAAAAAAAAGVDAFSGLPVSARAEQKGTVQ